MVQCFIINRSTVELNIYYLKKFGKIYSSLLGLRYWKFLTIFFIKTNLRQLQNFCFWKTRFETLYEWNELLNFDSHEVILRFMCNLALLPKMKQLGIWKFMKKQISYALFSLCLILKYFAIKVIGIYLNHNSLRLTWHFSFNS